MDFHGFSMKIKVFEQNGGILSLGDVPGGFMEVPGGCRVVI